MNAKHDDRDRKERPAAPESSASTEIDEEREEDLLYDDAADAAAVGGGDAGQVAFDEEDEERDHVTTDIREELEELERLRERHLRLAAEYDNFRKRTRKEMAEARERAQAELVGRLLDALDDLQRVLDTPADATTVEALHEGVELVDRKLSKELREAGLEPIEAEGQPFDPHLHEALLATPVSDPEREGLVSRVLVKGYRFGDRVVRPARVGVTTYQPSSEETEGGAG